MYDRYNKMYFDDGLPDDVELKFVTKAELGEFGEGWECAYGYAEEYFIGINLDMSDTMMLLRSTLLHEMVHIWQVWNAKKVNHGKHYKKWAEHFRNVHDIEIDLITKENEWHEGKMTR